VIAKKSAKMTSHVSATFLMMTMLALIAAFAPARHVLAHAILLSSNPARNATVPGEELNIELRFNSRIDASRSLLVLAQPDSKIQTLVILKSTAPALMEAKVTHLVPGAYTLRWQVLASDGHVSRGEIPFTVRNGN
jgi:methionine-rich copper-binding protein CopC